MTTPNSAASQIPGYFCRIYERALDGQTRGLVEQINVNEEQQSLLAGQPSLFRPLSNAYNDFRQNKTEENSKNLAYRIVRVALETGNPQDPLSRKTEKVAVAVLKGWIRDEKRNTLEEHLHDQVEKESVKQQREEKRNEFNATCHAKLQREDPSHDHSAGETEGPLSLESEPDINTQPLLEEFRKL